MPESKTVQPNIVDRLDRALEALEEQGHKPVAIYLTGSDWGLLDAEVTRVHREETGSTAFLWTTSYRDVPLYNEKGMEVMPVPVRRSWNGLRESAIYGPGGHRVKVL